MQGEVLKWEPVKLQLSSGECIGTMNILIAVDHRLSKVYLKILTLCKLLLADGDIPSGSYIACCSISQQRIAAIRYVLNPGNLEYLLAQTNVEYLVIGVSILRIERFYGWNVSNMLLGLEYLPLLFEEEQVLGGFWDGINLFCSLRLKGNLY